MPHDPVQYSAIPNGTVAVTGDVLQPRDNRQRGQILPLAAIFLVFGLLGVSALVIDVARVYTLQQSERSVADAAALAGAQDLQIPGVRTDPGSAERATARSTALTLLSRQLGGAPSITGCTPTADITDCAIVDAISGIAVYHVAITTPYSGALTVRPATAIKVTVSQPAVQLTFSRIWPFNQTHWNVGISSVAGLMFPMRYAVGALRPPETNGHDVANVTVNGQALVIIEGGDIGTNRSYDTPCPKSPPYGITLDANHVVAHFDPYVPCSPPAEQKLGSLVPDPNFPIPSRTGAPTSGVDAAGCAAIVSSLYSQPGYASFIPIKKGVPDTGNITCYKPGIYSTTLTATNGKLAILEPGLYFLDGGASISGGLIGGYVKSSPGVAIVVPRDQGFSSSGGANVSVNAGDMLAWDGTKVIISSDPSAREASPALDYANNPVQTSGTVNLTMTLIVQKDPNCTVTQPYPTLCNDLQNKAISLTGGGDLFLAGVQYAPTDHSKFAGSASGVGLVGEVVSWTIDYLGNAAVTQKYATVTDYGTVRLDTACSAGASCP
jgi:hypothetical protein